MSRQRKDGFRPSVINPAEFEFVAQHYLGHSEEAWEALCNEMADEHENLLAHQALHPGFIVAGHKWPGICDCCGARYLYGATFYTAKANTYISIGGICASKMRMGDPGAMKQFRERINTYRLHAEKVAKARAYFARVGLTAMLDMYLDKDQRSMEFPERTLRDMCGKVVGWGSELSERQHAFAVSLLKQIADRPSMLAERAAKDAHRKPIPAFIKRATIEGVVLSAKHVESDYGTTLKIVVEHADGWKLYGTCPSEIREELGGFHEAVDFIKGKRVRFDAQVIVSDNDPKFGFFKRPTKDSILDKLDENLAVVAS